MSLLYTTNISSISQTEAQWEELIRQTTMQVDAYGKTLDSIKPSVFLQEINTARHMEIIRDRLCDLFTQAYHTAFATLRILADGPRHDIIRDAYNKCASYKLGHAHHHSLTRAIPFCSDMGAAAESGTCLLPDLEEGLTQAVRVVTKACAKVTLAESVMVGMTQAWRSFENARADNARIVSLMRALSFMSRRTPATFRVSVLCDSASLKLLRDRMAEERGAVLEELAQSSLTVQGLLSIIGDGQFREYVHRKIADMNGRARSGSRVPRELTTWLFEEVQSMVAKRIAEDWTGTSVVQTKDFLAALETPVQWPVVPHTKPSHLLQGFATAMSTKSKR